MTTAECSVCKDVLSALCVDSGHLIGQGTPRDRLRFQPEPHPENDGPEKWVPEAIAQQEEYLKRTRSCQGQLGLSHSWETFSTAPGGSKYEACWRCRVTRTDADYQISLPPEGSSS